MQLPRAEMKVAKSPPWGVCTGDSVCLEVGCGLDGTSWHQREPLEGQLGLSSPDAWASLRTWSPEGEWAFPPGCLAPAELSAGGEWLEGFTVSSPPTALAVCKDFCLHMAARPSPGLFTNEAGVGRGWGKGREGGHRNQSLCSNGALSSGCWREC